MSFSRNSVTKNENFSSLLDTKETFLHFSEKTESQNLEQRKKNLVTSATNECKLKTTQKSLFKLKTNRLYNLKKADKLELSSFRDDAKIQRVIKQLRCCSSQITLESDKKTSQLFQASKKCRSPHCAICSRQRSSQLVDRVKNAMNESEQLNDKYFYFLNLTLKHNETVRNYIYLDELKKYIAKLKRSKLFLEMNVAGLLTNYETTITQKLEYHIHSHILVATSKKITKPVKLLEREISANWGKITKDSNVIKLILLGRNEQKIEDAVLEVCKYGTKTERLGEFNVAAADRLASWIMKTANKNFINASGCFRGLQLASKKSDYDSEFEIRSYDLEKTLNYAKTVEVDVREINETYLVDEQFSRVIDVTEIREAVKMYMQVSSTDKQINTYITDLMNDNLKAKEEAEQTKSEIEKYERRKALDLLQEKKVIELMKTQRTLFESDDYFRINENF